MTSQRLAALVPNAEDTRNGSECNRFSDASASYSYAQDTATRRDTRDHVNETTMRPHRFNSEAGGTHVAKLRVFRVRARGTQGNCSESKRISECTSVRRRLSRIAPRTPGPRRPHEPSAPERARERPRTRRTECTHIGAILSFTLVDSAATNKFGPPFWQHRAQGAGTRNVTPRGRSTLSTCPI